jgi:thiamine biosynthesis lipoprotein
VTADAVPGVCTFPALGSTAELVVTDASCLPAAERLLRAQLAELDAACSRFRPDSEISRLHARPGVVVPVSVVLAGALDAALRAAAETDGLVDPTVGEAIVRLGYDRDFAAMVPDDSARVVAAGPAPGWWRIGFDATGRTVSVPRGVSLDLGATAKAWAADRAAQDISAVVGCGVLVSLGGDVAVAGPAPSDGWAIVVGDDHRTADPDRDPVVAIFDGGLATSSTTCRSWRRGGLRLHHIVDPRTGDVPAAEWRTVTVSAGSCLAANIASTAAVVLGAAAPRWLDERGLPARLVRPDGRVVALGGWPAEDAATPRTTLMPAGGGR